MDLNPYWDPFVLKTGVFDSAGVGCSLEFWYTKMWPFMVGLMEKRKQKNVFIYVCFVLNRCEITYIGVAVSVIVTAIIGN